jgi:hypothetical protein
VIFAFLGAVWRLWVRKVKIRLTKSCVGDGMAGSTDHVTVPLALWVRSGRSTILRKAWSGYGNVCESKDLRRKDRPKDYRDKRRYDRGIDLQMTEIPSDFRNGTAYGKGGIAFRLHGKAYTT